MTGHDAPSALDAAPSAPDPPTSGLSWPPPGLEPLQGRLARVVALVWIGSVLLVAPLFWAVAVEQPFWSLGPLEDEWAIGIGIAALGLVILLASFASLFNLLRAAARAADRGYGARTLAEVMTDGARDTGFLVQGRRHYAHVPPRRRAALVRGRLRSDVLLLAGGLWLPASFALSVSLAARGFLTPSGIGLLTLGPAALATALGILQAALNTGRAAASRRRWVVQAGGRERVAAESEGWQRRLAAAGDDVVLGAGAPGRGRTFRRASLAVAALFVFVLVPTGTLAVTSAVGPTLADVAIPTFLSVQEMAGAAEVLREHRLEPDGSITPQRAGDALQNLAFVGAGQRPDRLERAPRERFDEDWFSQPDVFPDPYSESVGYDLVVTPLASRPAEERASLLRAAAHPAQAELDLLARAPRADVVSARWSLPFPDGESVFTLPWPRFAALRSAGIAHVARAAVELDDGRADEAERTVREVVSAGFLLVDEGPTLIDNLIGVALAEMGGDALEALYERTGRPSEAERLRRTRAAAAAAARSARVGIAEQDVHTLLRGIPDLVEREDALRGLRWEYFATFNLLAPCINAHKMVFGPDATYQAWVERAEEGLVRVPGEAALFDLAREGAFGDAEAAGRPGALATLLAAILGADSAPGSCARLVSALELQTARNAR